MSIEKLELPKRLDEERIAVLKDLFPEIFADGSVDSGALKEALSDLGEDEEGSEEHYGLTWPGKRQAKKLAVLPPTGTLSPVSGEGLNEETTKNILIEGDNLEVLRILQKSYVGRIKMIYIDPPYNTGQDFIYKDDFKEPLEAYLQRSGQSDEEGLLTSNPKASGRYHSNWLSMMFPRLRLARNLLKKDGIIFVSIDDNEVHNLRYLMDEVFGPENFLACIAWEKRYTRSNNAKLFYSLKDSILVYRRSELVEALREPRTSKADEGYKNPDNDPRGPWTTSSYVNPATKVDRPKLVYDIEAPDGRIVTHPTHAWKYSPDEHKRHVAEGLLWWGKDGSAIFPRLKLFLSETDGMVPIDLWGYEASGTTDEGGQEVKNLFDGKAVFDNPKPTKLIKRMLALATSVDNEDIVLDFFAGSGSTGHAVLDKNREDGGNRRFILVQLPEKVVDPKFKTIADVTCERIRRSIAQLAEMPQQMDLDPVEEWDAGFRVFKLTRSNVTKWRQVESTNLEALNDLFSSKSDSLVDGWSLQDVITEIMLVEGFPLGSCKDTWNACCENVVYVIGYPDISHSLLICLDEKINAETLKLLEKMDSRDIFVCLDSALNDQAKLMLSDGLKIKTL